jgi:hypothetical protein
VSEKENRPEMLSEGGMIERAKALVGLYYQPGTNVYIVWFAKTLGNWKALVSTDVMDDTYYEVTHNGAKHETYVDVYVKTINKVFPDNAQEENA